MQWYYAQNDQQKGPISETDLNSLVASGMINDQTLVWHEGQANWRTYGEIKPASGAAAMAAPPVVEMPPVVGHVVCAECGRSFPPDQTIGIGLARVCAACKPIFVQRLREGVAPTTRPSGRGFPVDAERLVEDVLRRNVTVDVGGCISRGWKLVTAHLGLTVGVSLLVLICMQAPGIIPILGACIGLILNGPLMGGLYIFFLKLVRGEPATVGDAFSGFSRRFGPLLGVFLLMCLLIYLPALPCAVYGAATHQFQRGGAPDVVFVLLAGIGFLVMIYLGVLFLFAVPLVADLELGPWTALQVSRRVVARRWFNFLFLGLGIVMVALLGVCALCVGILVAAPVIYATLMYAYEDVFGQAVAQLGTASQEPLTPTPQPPAPTA